MKRLVIIFLALAMPVFAQQPPAPGPQLTEIQKLKLENLQLKYNQAEMMKKQAMDQEAQLMKDFQALSLEVGKEHPGYMLDPQGNLTPAPKAAEKPKEVKPVDKQKEEAKPAAK